MNGSEGSSAWGGHGTVVAALQQCPLHPWDGWDLGAFLLCIPCDGEDLAGVLRVSGRPFAGFLPQGPWQDAGGSVQSASVGTGRQGLPRTPT